MTPKAQILNFDTVETWIFDLDNTLSPPSCNLFAQVDHKMTQYVRALLDVPYEVARKIQKDFYRDYGTTLRGLMDCHQIDPDDFLSHVHDIDYSWLQPNPTLAAAIKNLKGRKIIFTNGSRRHAENTLKQLGLVDIFEDIFDIKDAHYIPKPDRTPYEQMLRHFNIDPTKAAMFEDLDRNLEIPSQMGMRTVLVVPENHPSPSLDTVNFITDNLSGFLESLD